MSDSIRDADLRQAAAEIERCRVSLRAHGGPAVFREKMQERSTSAEVNLKYAAILMARGGSPDFHLAFLEKDLRCFEILSARS